MRILLVDHTPLSAPAGALPPEQLTAGLTAAGKHVRLLAVGDDRSPAAAAFGERVEWISPAVARLPLPVFHGAKKGEIHYDKLTAEQLAAYRQLLRTRLDQTMSHFEPQIIHCQQTWLFGHLALESGAPYVLSLHGADLLAYYRDVRCRPLVEQAVENAGALFVMDDTQAELALAAFPSCAEILTAMPANSAQRLAAVLAVYQRVVSQRFGEWEELP